MSTMRFGRRLPAPSTLQIRHELIAMMRKDAQQASAKAAEGTETSSKRPLIGADEMPPTP